MGITKNSVMVSLTFVFVSVYAAALIGWIHPWGDLTLITRLEPIIFVIIGYYFGRLPSLQNEKTLKDEIDRRTRKADAVQQAKQQVEIELESMSEKIRSARLTLRPLDHISHNSTRFAGEVNRDVGQSIHTAVEILNI